jgi:hypothetical protein
MCRFKIHLEDDLRLQETMEEKSLSKTTENKPRRKHPRKKKMGFMTVGVLGSDFTVEFYCFQDQVGVLALNAVLLLASPHV